MTHCTLIDMDFYLPDGTIKTYPAGTTVTVVSRGDERKLPPAARGEVVALRRRAHRAESREVAPDAPQEIVKLDGLWRRVERALLRGVRRGY